MAEIATEIRHHDTGIHVRLHPLVHLVYDEGMAKTLKRRFPVYRSWMGYDLEQETPVGALYNVGDGVKPYGWEGVAACAEGVRLVVNRITGQR